MNDKDITIEEMYKFLENFKRKEVTKLKKQKLMLKGNLDYLKSVDPSALNIFNDCPKEKQDKMKCDLGLCINLLEIEINTLSEYFNYVLAALRTKM